MKILTWNINGIRASKVPLKQLFDSLCSDIICLQETKVTRDMLDERSAIVDGYSSYYSFSNVRTGYSGVATFVRDTCTPLRAEQGLSGSLSCGDNGHIGCYGDMSEFTEEELVLLDKEGRAVLTQHSIIGAEEKEELLTIINVYCPRADPEREDRKAFKLRFYQLLQIRAEALLDSGSHVIILGDVNTAHKQIDRCDPCEAAEFYKEPGRIWLDQLLCTPNQMTENLTPIKGNGKETVKSDVKSSEDIITKTPQNPYSGRFVDTFRYYHPTVIEHYTCWNTMIGARETNFGSRIDYILADMPLVSDHFSGCEILADVMGSDHCPVRSELTCSIRGAAKCPPLCTKYFPEFVGIQTKLSAFFTKGVKRSFEAVDSAGSAGKQTTSSQESLPTNDSRTLNQAKSFPPSSKHGKFEKSSKSGKNQMSLNRFFKKSVECDKDKVNAVKLTDATTPVSCPEPKPPQKASSNAWKNLLKGPPPAPLCKGHMEACLLRTVKKEDSLNKGRQFYVCPRPEGLKTNPLARCDHFEWLEKKRKVKS